MNDYEILTVSMWQVRGTYYYNSKSKGHLTCRYHLIILTGGLGQSYKIRKGMQRSERSHHYMQTIYIWITYLEGKKTKRFIQTKRPTKVCQIQREL